MKRNIGLVVDSTFGFDKKYAKENDITIVPLKVIIEDKEYVDGEIEPQIINNALYEKRDVKTSQPSPEQFMKAYEDQLTRYEQVICMTISKSLSGTFNSANLGKTILENENIYIVDTETNINGAAYLAEKLIEYLDQGHHISDALGYLEALKEKGSLVFTVDNLQFLVKSGRIGRVQAVIGNVLKIKPILRFERGVLGLESKVRGFNNVIAYLVKEVEEIFLKGKAIVRIAYVDKSVEAKMLEHEIYQLGDNVDVKITGIISPVVSAHVGPGGLGIYLTLA
ncbi:MAG: DegV family protein [Acholeplasmataceae bacterium]|nr:DegV family protein [Acholeplasmataceae bacterium]